jgi:hypothetical protein
VQVKEKLMDRSLIEENARSRERLQKIVNGMSDEELQIILYTEGWTIAVALAHIAFWDARRLQLIKKWEKEGVTSSEIEGDIINDALIPFFLALPPRKAAELAVSSAQELDRKLEGLSPDFIAGIEKLGDRHSLNRSIHRNIHLDEIENLLKTRRGGN